MTMKLKFSMVKKIVLSILLPLVIFSKSIACEILNVPIETPVEIAMQKFDFLERYNQENFTETTAVIYDDFASEYCSSGDFKKTSLEVMIFQSKVALIKLIAPKNDQLNEVYRFTKNFIQDPGNESQTKNWNGYVDLSIGDLIIWYSRVNQQGFPYEILEITNSNMVKYIEGEHVEKDPY